MTFAFFIQYAKRINKRHFLDVIPHLIYDNGFPSHLSTTLYLLCILYRLLFIIPPHSHSCLALSLKGVHLPKH